MEISATDNLKIPIGLDLFGEISNKKNISLWRYQNFVVVNGLAFRFCCMQ